MENTALKTINTKLTINFLKQDNSIPVNHIVLETKIL